MDPSLISSHLFDWFPHCRPLCCMVENFTGWCKFQNFTMKEFAALLAFELADATDRYNCDPVIFDNHASHEKNVVACNKQPVAQKMTAGAVKIKPHTAKAHKVDTS